jgi:hypothetical protein
VDASKATPAEAVDHLYGLGTGIRAAVVLKDGAVVAHSGEDVGRGHEMRDLMIEFFERADAASGNPVDQLEVSTAGGAVFAVRRASWAIGVVADRLSLSSLMLYDLRATLLELQAVPR